MGNLSEKQHYPLRALARFANSIEAFYKPIYTWLGYIGAAALAALVLAMVWSIVGRKFFNAPLKGSTEITQLGLVVMTFLVLGAEHMGHEKMTVDIIVKHFPRRLQEIIAPIIYILVIAIFCILCWQLVVLGITYQDGQSDTAQPGREDIPVRIPSGVWNHDHDPDLHSTLLEIPR